MAKVVGVTMGFDNLPTTVDEDGNVLSRDVEMILRKKYYPKGRGSWPVDPNNGKKLETVV